MPTLYSLITGILQPFTAAMLVMGVVIFWHRPGHLSHRTLKIGYVLCYLASTPWAACTSTWWLEHRYPRLLQRPEKLDAIVVLSGGILRDDADPSRYQLDESSLRRCRQAARLYALGSPCPILAAGGHPEFAPDMPSAAELMGQTLEEFGVAATDVYLEPNSRSTAENARFSAPILREHGWQRIALVTSATHLWRAERLFRNEGIETVPVGCLYRTEEFEWNLFAFLPRARAVERQHEAWHEFLGVVYLIVQGRW